MKGWGGVYLSVHKERESTAAAAALLYVWSPLLRQVPVYLQLRINPTEHTQLITE